MWRMPGRSHYFCINVLFPPPLPRFTSGSAHHTSHLHKFTKGEQMKSLVGTDRRAKCMGSRNKNLWPGVILNLVGLTFVIPGIWMRLAPETSAVIIGSAYLLLGGFLCLGGTIALIQGVPLRYEPSCPSCTRELEYHPEYFVYFCPSCQKYFQHAKTKNETVP